MEKSIGALHGKEEEWAVLKVNSALYRTKNRETVNRRCSGGNFMVGLR